MPGSIGPPGVTAAHCTRRSSRCVPLVSLKRCARQDSTSSSVAFTVLGTCNTGWGRGVYSASEFGGLMCSEQSAYR